MKFKVLARVMARFVAVSACSLGSLIPIFGSNSSTGFSQAVDPNTHPLPVTTALYQSQAAGVDSGTFRLCHKPQ